MKATKPNPKDSQGVLLSQVSNVIHLVVAPAQHKSDIDPPIVSATLVKIDCTVILRADSSSEKMEPLEILRRAVAQLEGESRDGAGKASAIVGR